MLKRNNFYFLASDTLRTKIYLYYLIKNKILPKRIFFLRSRKKNLPGSFKKKIVIKNKSILDFDNKFYTFKDLESFLNSKNFFKNIENIVDVKYFNTEDINSRIIYEEIRKLKKNVILFSGFGGSIVKKKLLNTKNFFLHCHGGYLPYFKGSTTNYYCMLENNFIGASAILLNNKIDAGPILQRTKFKLPKFLNEMDDIIDSVVRSIVLVKCLKKIKKGIKINFKSNKNNKKNYFIIHPFLKNLSIKSL